MSREFLSGREALIRDTCGFVRTIGGYGWAHIEKDPVNSSSELGLGHSVSGDGYALTKIDTADFSATYGSVRTDNGKGYATAKKDFGWQLIVRDGRDRLLRSP